MNDIIIESLGGLVIKYKMGMDHSNEQSWNRSQKQLIETPDPQFNSGFNKQSHSIVFLLFYLSIDLFVTLIIRVIQYS